MQLSSLYLCLLAGAVQQGLAGYTLVDDYNASNFFSKFSFFDTADPTHGYVQYLDQGNAASQGLINTGGNAIYMGVDHTNVASGAGRSSVRVTSNTAYNHGLVILDASHMPEGCGTWPAFWMVGSNWPNNGEIDIIEGVNDQNANAMTLHTGPGCTIGSSGFSGTLSTPNCYINAPGQYSNQGCGIDATTTNTYGAGFNANQGGVYATKWNSQGISIYFFPRQSIPSDISSGNPNPDSWGSPVAYFAGSGCNYDASFRDLQIVFDTTFCGDWAGSVWGQGSCGAKAASCQAFVQNNPSAFANAYWSINSLRVYQDGSTNGGAPTSSAPGAPSGVASTSLTSIAPIPQSTSAPPPFSATASVSLWNGDGFDGAPTPTPSASISTPIAKAPAPATTTAPTSVAPATTAPTSVVPATTAPTSVAPTTTTAAPVVQPTFWDGEGWDGAPIPSATPEISAPVAKAPQPTVASSSSSSSTKKASPTFWNGYDLPPTGTGTVKLRARDAEARVFFNGYDLPTDEPRVIDLTKRRSRRQARRDLLAAAAVVDAAF